MYTLNFTNTYLTTESRIFHDDDKSQNKILYRNFWYTHWMSIKELNLYAYTGDQLCLSVTTVLSSV